MLCPICQLDLVVVPPLKTKRKISIRPAYTTNCKCGAQVQYLSGEPPDLYGVNVRFTHNRSVWNMWHQVKNNFTRFVLIERHKPDVPRTEHTYPGLITPERFKRLVVFL
jgi:hypothetical protein